MAGYNGRALKVEWDGTVLVGVRTRGYTISNEYVDVTTDDDLGWRTLLATPGLRSMEVTVGGISSSEVLIAEIMKSSITGEPLEMQLPSSLSSPGNITGNFVCSSFEQTGEHDGAVEFSATFMSMGAVTYTASSGT